MVSSSRPSWTPIPVALATRGPSAPPLDTENPDLEGPIPAISEPSSPTRNTQDWVLPLLDVYEALFDERQHSTKPTRARCMT